MQLAVARGTLLELLAAIERRRYTNAEIEEVYCARSPAEVLDAGSIHFSAPCADLSIAAAQLLSVRGFPVTLVLGGMRRPLQRPKFQCGLELETDAGTMVVGFGVSSNYFYRGRFLPTRRRPLVERRRYEPGGGSFLERFFPSGRRALARFLPGYDLERDIASHVRRNRPLAFRLARWKAIRRANSGRPTHLPEAGRWGPPNAAGRGDG